MAFAQNNARQAGEPNNVSQLQSGIEALQRQNADLTLKCDSLYKLMQQQKELSNMRLDSLNKAIAATNKAVVTNKTDTDHNQANMQDKLNDSIIYGSAALLALLIVSFIIYMAMKRRQKRNSTAINDMAKAQQDINEQQLKLDSLLTELMERQLNSETLAKEAAKGAAEPVTDHSLATAIAGEITRIEQNLAFMDPATKGLSQLRNRTSAIFATLKKKGYEIPSLVGTEFKEGMNYETVMEEDEDMEPGVMRIKRVTQPCVMYNGKMIQPAKVVVAYNPDY